MSEYRLHCVAESGNCYKVALMLTLCGSDWQPLFVDYFKGETRGDQYRQSVNELGEVPVLEHNGRQLTQSGAILTYLADATGKFGGRDARDGPAKSCAPRRWISGAQRKPCFSKATLEKVGKAFFNILIEILRWMLFDNHKFTSYYATLRWLVGIEKQADPAVVQFLRGRVLGAFGIVEKHLANNAFMLGERPTIADFSMVGYHYFNEQTSVDRSEFPNIIAWTQRIADLPGRKHPYELMPRGAPSP